MLLLGDKEMVKYVKKWLWFSKKFPFLHIRSNARASLIIVKDLSQMCDTEAEKFLYDQLRANTYYPTPHYWINGVRINVALVPYKLALIETRAGMDEKRIVRLLKKQKWRAVFYDAKQLLQDEHTYVKLVLQHAPQQTKNVSTSS